MASGGSTLSNIKRLTSCKARDSPAVYLLLIMFIMEMSLYIDTIWIVLSFLKFMSVVPNKWHNQIWQHYSIWMSHPNVNILIQVENDKNKLTLLCEYLYVYNEYSAQVHEPVRCNEEHFVITSLTKCLGYFHNFAYWMKNIIWNYFHVAPRSKYVYLEKRTNCS